MRTFKNFLGASRACADFRDPTAFSRIMHTLYKLLILSCLAGLSFAGQADVCLDVMKLPQFSKSAEIESEYFDRYVIDKSKGVYHLFATRTEAIELESLAAILDDYTQWPKVLGPFKNIETHPLNEQSLLMGITFRPSFSPFTSKFTNKVEILRQPNRYRQCWRQLNKNDPQVIEPYNFEPKESQGYWQLEQLAGHRVRLEYYATIKPPIPIPGWLYRYIVKNSYPETFQDLVAVAKAEF